MAKPAENCYKKQKKHSKIRIDCDWCGKQICAECIYVDKNENTLCRKDYKLAMK